MPKLDLPEVDLKKWWSSADPISKNAFKELKRSGASPSDRQCILLIEMIDGFWATQAMIEAVLGRWKAGKYGLEIQSILNRMIVADDEDAVQRGLNSDACPLIMDEAAAEWWEKRRQELVASFDPAKERRFNALLSRLREMDWGGDDRERVRAASWAVRSEHGR